MPNNIDSTQNGYIPNMQNQTANIQSQSNSDDNLSYSQTLCNIFLEAALRHPNSEMGAFVLSCRRVAYLGSNEEFDAMAANCTSRLQDVLFQVYTNGSLAGLEQQLVYRVLGFFIFNSFAESVPQQQRLAN